MANWAIYLFISGTVFFIGVITACVAVTAWNLVEKRLVRSTLTVTIVLAILLVLLSATPLPLIFYAGWCALLVISWFFNVRRHIWAKRAVALLWIVSIVLLINELRYHVAPSIETIGLDTLYVIGDSLSMGADPPHKNWPDVLGEQLAMETHTFSFGGARTDTALSNAMRVDRDSALVLLEIGGNDLLYGSNDFDENLEALLSAVCNGKRSIVMVELPLPPAYNHFGLSQRRLAKKYGVTLIPKRFLARVLTTEGNTTDGLHLSNSGHVSLANVFAPLFLK